MKYLIYALLIVSLLPSGVYACYGEFCSTSLGAVYDIPTKVINKLTVPELMDPTLILNDPKGYVDKQSTNNYGIGSNSAQVTICKKGKKRKPISKIIH